MSLFKLIMIDVMIDDRLKPVLESSILVYYETNTTIVVVYIVEILF